MSIGEVMVVQWKNTSVTANTHSCQAEIQNLDPYYFEGSWVLSVEASDVGAVLTIEAVLTPQHPKFGPPRPGEHYAYELTALRFDGAATPEFQPSGASPIVGPSGETDLGNIDVFGVGPAGSFFFEGESGTLEMKVRP